MQNPSLDSIQARVFRDGVGLNDVAQNIASDFFDECLPDFRFFGENQFRRSFEKIPGPLFDLLGKLPFAPTGITDEESELAALTRLDQVVHARFARTEINAGHDFLVEKFRLRMQNEHGPEDGSADMDVSFRGAFLVEDRLPKLANRPVGFAIQNEPEDAFFVVAVDQEHDRLLKVRIEKRRCGDE